LRTFGGLAPFPRRFGGGKPRLQFILESLNAQRGTGYDVHPSSNIYAENMALARAIDGGWAVNGRLANVLDGYRTALIERWEKILGIPIVASDPDYVRRARIAERQARFGRQAIASTIISALQTAMGGAYVAVEFISIDNAVVHVPDATYPWGDVADGSPWYSTTAHVLIRTQKPAGWSEADFLSAVGNVHEILDPLVPAWVTYDWYRQDGTPINVSGGPSAAGFYLADANNLSTSPQNLDYEVFDRYSPADEGNLTWWIDPRDYAAGTSPATIADKTGLGGRDATQSVPQNRPTIVSGAINGQRAAYWSSATQTMATPSFAWGTATAWTVFVVWKATSVNSSPTILRNAQCPVKSSLSQFAWGLRETQSDAGIASDLDAVTQQMLHIPSAAHWGYGRLASNNLYVSIDGSPETSVAAGTTSFPTDIVYLSANGYLGYTGTILVYNTSLSAAAISRVGAYLKSEWKL
jgi:hypothetical protein